MAAIEAEGEKEMIKVSNLHVSYGGEEVLSGLDADFPRGEISVILGPNGCGKSTLLKAIVRLLPTDVGTIILDGQDMAELTQHELSQRIAYLPQVRNVPDIKVGRLVLHGRFPYLGYPRRYRREDREKVMEALAQVGIDALKEHQMEDLSGGQRQKAYLAMALAQDTNLILLDEPTTYLDIRNQLDMLKLLRKLSDAGKTIVMILHDFDLALQSADHAVLMGEGRVLCSGKPRDVLASETIKRIFEVRPVFCETEYGLRCFVR